MCTTPYINGSRQLMTQTTKSSHSVEGHLRSRRPMVACQPLAPARFLDASSPAFHGSFTQPLISAIGSPAAARGARTPSPPSLFTVSLGLSPTALLGSPRFFSPTGGVNGAQAACPSMGVRWWRGHRYPFSGLRCRHKLLRDIYLRRPILRLGFRFASELLEIA
jgi:hypothetical protein